ncbi:hypothetical protein ACVBEF_06280 [Glaciimonas sp. GG7]
MLNKINAKINATKILAVCVTVVLSGCGKEASTPQVVAPQSALEKGISTYLANRHQCITVTSRWPATATAGSNTYSKLDSFVSAGLLKVEISTSGSIFSPTDIGNTVFVSKDGSQQLCLDVPDIVQVTKVTPIKESGKKEFSEVTFSYRINNIPEWAKNTKVKLAYAVIAEKADGQVLVATEYFHETSNGWEVVKSGNDAFFGTKMKPMRPL